MTKQWKNKPEYSALELDNGSLSSYVNCITYMSNNFKPHIEEGTEEKAYLKDGIVYFNGFFDGEISPVPKKLLEKKELFKKEHKLNERNANIAQLILEALETNDYEYGEPIFY